MVKDGYLTDNPALQVEKPKQQESHRRPLTPQERADVWRIAVTTGNDPHLDGLLVRFHEEVGARRGGALSLRIRDLDEVGLRVYLREKGKTDRWVPVSRTLLRPLLDHAQARGATGPQDAVFRQKPKRGEKVGAPLTSRRYDNLAKRWQTQLPWATTDLVSVHWLRHTAIAEVERLAGLSVARKFAGHTDDAGVTTLSYTKASPAEVAAAQSQRTGEAHPLAPDALLGAIDFRGGPDDGAEGVGVLVR